MSLFSEFVHGVTKGLVSAACEESSASELVESCCQQLGWEIDERVSANDVRLHFKDPLVEIRKVVIYVGGQDTAVAFAMGGAVVSHAEILRHQREGMLPLDQLA